jgi:hypothetical protein
MLVSTANLLVRLVYGETIPLGFKGAPPRKLLQKFGGPMTIEEFRATGALDINTTEMQLPFLPHTSGIEEIEHQKVTISDEYNKDGDKNIEEFVLSNMSLRHLQMRTTQGDELANKTPLTIQINNYSNNRPTINEQLDVSKKRLRLQKDKISMNDRHKKKKKKKDLRDYMCRQQT